MSRERRQELRFHIPELHCPNETAVIEKALRAWKDDLVLEPDYVARELTIRLAPDTCTEEELATALRTTGFSIIPLRDANIPPETDVRMVPLPPTLVAGIVFLLAAVSYYAVLGVPSRLIQAFLLAAIATAGIPLFREAWTAIRLKTLDMNVLMTIAVTGAVLTKSTWEGAVAVVLYGLSLWIEDFSLTRARHAITRLVTLVPQVAHLWQSDDDMRDVPVSAIRPGDRILVKPGERIPTDGRVYRGTSTVDEAPITGESMPQEKKPGDTVYGGSLNTTGVLVFEATVEPEQSIVSGIRRLIDQARSNRSRVETQIDRFAARYTPAVIALATAVGGIGATASVLGFGGADALPPAEWAYRALVVLVVACPCALVISTPVTIVAGLYRAAAAGIIVKGGRFLEAAANLRTIAFDKTGTLTEGRPRVVAVHPRRGDEEALVRVAASLEAVSDHPLAKAVTEYARERAVTVHAVSNCEELPGQGITGSIDDRSYFVGSRDYCESRGMGEQCSKLLAELGEPAHTAVFIGNDRELMGVILLADTPRVDAKSAVENLTRLGIEAIILSGDRQAVVDKTARELGIDKAHGDLLPADKIEAIRRLSAEQGPVAMVGDGINDGPALAVADVGIVLGATASDTALEVADIAGTGNHVCRLPYVVELGRRVQALIRQNIALALGIKLFVLAAALIGWAGMWLAVLADVGASLVVVLNGCRIVRFPEPSCPAQRALDS
ncbi:heavy metal translocating P-type ATPase [Thermostilla marina]